MPKRYFAAALLYPALALFSVAVHSTSLPSVAAAQPKATKSTAKFPAGSVQQVFERAGQIGGERHSRVRTTGMSDMTKAELDALPRDDLKLYAAADFLGFYYVNTQTFVDVCRAEGVDLAAYVHAFKKKHEAQFARADEVTRGSAFSTARMSTIDADSRELMETNVRHTMIDMATGLRQTTVAHSCAYVAENAVEVVSASYYADHNPVLEAAFMSDEIQIKRPESLPASNPYLGKKINRHRATHDESAETSQ